MAFRPPPKLMLPLFRLHMIPTVDLRQLRVPERPCLGTPCPSFCRRGSRKALIRTVFADEAGRGRYSRLMCGKTAYIEPDIHPITRRIRVNPHTLVMTWIYRAGSLPRRGDGLLIKPRPAGWIRMKPAFWADGEILLAGDRPERENGKEIRAFPVTQA